MRAKCPTCGSVSPLPGVAFLPKTETKTPKRGVVDTLSVWEVNGNHCTFCGRSRALCERLGIGLTAQHVCPFSEAGDDWPLVPFCARCQEISAAQLRATRDIVNTLAPLDAVIKRIEALNPEWRQPPEGS